VYKSSMRFTVILTLLLGLGGLSAPVRAADSSSKELIEFGWDEPDTAFLRANIVQMRQTPFDGCVFHADYRTPAGETGSFTWQAWGKRAFTETDLREAFSDLRDARFGRFKSNFLRFNTTPAKLDWFDDYSAVLANAKLAARLAQAGGCPGILFDIEQYEGQLFDYAKQRDAATKSWEAYAAQARRRGAQVMRAFQAGYPGLTLFLTFGYSLSWMESGQGKKPLAQCRYGLLAPFLDGMVQAARGHTRLVDGYELSYGYKTRAQFAAARQTVKEALLPIVANQDKYRRVFSLGFGLWLDRDWRKQGWHIVNPAKNYFSPEAFEASVRAALQEADRYVWVYSESPRWWSPEGRPVKLPSVYATALKAARHVGH
jgi:hypothetical protein